MAELNWDDEDYTYMDDDEYMDDFEDEEDPDFEMSEAVNESATSSVSDSAQVETQAPPKPGTRRSGNRPARKNLKVELKNIALPNHVKDYIMNTLRDIYGPNYTLDSEIPTYNRRELNNRFWVNQGQLVVRNCYDYSNRNDERKKHVNPIALENLEKYGFYTNHCIEALIKADSIFENALKILLSFYFRVNLSYRHGSVTEKSISERREEISSLTSIYESICEVRTPDKHWLFHLDLPYLAEWYFKGFFNDAGSVKNVRRKRPLCKFFMTGNCRFGDTCRFSHENPNTEKNRQLETERKRKSAFLLEVRFPDDCNYPSPDDLPLIMFSSEHVEFSKNALLRVTKVLYEEAKSCAEQGYPYCYNLITKLIVNSDDIIQYLNNKEISQLNMSPDIPLFPSLASNNESAPPTSSQNLRHNDKRFCSDRKSANESSISDEDLISMIKYRQTNRRYLKMQRCREQLPAWNVRHNILAALHSHQVVVIVGETGCGKSTQVPQFILDEWLENLLRSDGRMRQQRIEIVCTQPRRLSAIGVATRVADERVEELGESVGYQIRLESRISSSTKLLFCTLGILMRRMENDPLLSSVTHVIVDEVHERGEESDFLLLILKDLLKRRSDLRVILMSATLNAEAFSKYFNNAPLIDIPGKMYPVAELFLEDILEITDYTIDEYSKCSRSMSKSMSRQIESIEVCLQSADVLSRDTISRPSQPDEVLTARQLFYRYKDYSPKTRKSILMTDTKAIDFELVIAILNWIVTGDHEYPKEGSILVFLPGLADIITIHDELMGHSVMSPRNGRFKIIPLHSSISNEEQNLVFRTEPGIRKIVLSTNIAETSITIDDCVFVIDCGKMKETYFDNDKNMTSLETMWISKANARQRKGRAGRVMPGLCIRMYTSNRAEYSFMAHPVPEIQRAALDQIVLHLKTMNNFKTRTPQEVLANLMEPPTENSIETAIERLRDIGALDSNNELTPLGRHLSALPVDIKIGKLILFGAIFCCLDPILTIAASLSHKSPFVSPFNKRDLAQTKKKRFAVMNSDHLTVLVAYQEWLKVSTMRRDRGRRFADENFLSWRSLEMMSDLKHQFLELLVSIGFISANTDMRRRRHEDTILRITSKELNQNSGNMKLLSGIICAALYPNLVEILTPNKTYIHSAAGSIPKEHSAGDLMFRTRRDGYVYLNRSSINADVAKFSSPYLVFQEKMKTGKIYINDSTMVSIISLVMFAGADLKIENYSGTYTISLDQGWLVFSVQSLEDANLLKVLRTELLKLLDKKIQDPSLDLTRDDIGRKIISTISYLVSPNSQM